MDKLEYIGYFEMSTCGLPLDKIMQGAPYMIVEHRDFKFLCKTTNQLVKNCKELMSYREYAKGKSIVCEYVNKWKRDFYIDGKWYGELKIGKQEMH